MIKISKNKKTAIKKKQTNKQKQNDWRFEYIIDYSSFLKENNNKISKIQSHKMQTAVASTSENQICLRVQEEVISEQENSNSLQESNMQNCKKT